MPTDTAVQTKAATQTVWSGILVGIGIAAVLDELVAHQLLNWHRLYDVDVSTAVILVDVFFHLFSVVAGLAGTAIFFTLRRRGPISLTRWWGGFLLGAGAFQLGDGVILHTALRSHPTVLDGIFPYDLLWNALAAVLVVAGVILLGRARSLSDSGD
jgi:uncharacterized membrane protein